MAVYELPARPDLEYLKKQAKTLLHGALQGEPAALERFRVVDPVLAQSAPKLADALHVTAREYGFAAWPELKRHVESLSDDPREVMTAAVKANDAALMKKVLAKYSAERLQLDEPLPNYAFDAQALIGAVNKDNREMVEMLLNAGADINVRTKWWAGGFGALDISKPEMTEYLISRGAYVDVHAAARLGMLGRVNELVEADPGLVHARGGDGQRPLHFAATVEIAEYLLSRGAEIDARDVDHESTAAQYLVAHEPRRPEVARYLISRGAKADILMASALGNIERVRGFLDEDPAMVRVSASDRYFPKMDPKSGGSIYIFGFGWGKTAPMLAREFGHEEVLRLLLQRSPLWFRLAQACELHEEAMVKELMEKHPNVIAAMPERALRYINGAAFRSNTQAVHMMLEAGWPSGVLGENDQTPLHFAAWHGNVAMVRELLRHGAAVDAEEMEHGGTPLKWALHGSENSWHREKGDYGAVVKALLDAGARVPGADEVGTEGSAEALAALRR